jgi:hypothetical protein
MIAAKEWYAYTPDSVRGTQCIIMKRRKRTDPTKFLIEATLDFAFQSQAVWSSEWCVEDANDVQNRERAEGSKSFEKRATDLAHGTQAALQ